MRQGATIAHEPAPPQKTIRGGAHIMPKSMMTNVG